MGEQQQRRSDVMDTRKLHTILAIFTPRNHDGPLALRPTKSEFEVMIILDSI
jgi:hypothetical protein